MELFYGITLLAVSFFIGLNFVVASKKDSEVREDIILNSGWIVFIISLIIGINLIDDYCSPSITPIDVYRGKTTLEITYKDSIAIDSIVVWKEEVK